jgi:hypothetical protein
VEGGARPLAVRIQFSGRRGTEPERMHGLILVRLIPPPSAGTPFEPRLHLSAERLLRYGEPFIPPAGAAAEWAAFIRRENAAPPAHEPAALHLRREFDSKALAALHDQGGYRSHFESLTALVRAPGDGPARAAVEEVHRRIFAPLVGEAGQMETTFDVEEADLPPAATEAPAPASEAAPPPVAASRPPIPFFPTGNGRAALLLKAGDVIAPEHDRTRQWIALAVAQSDHDADSVIVRCRLLGPFGLNESPATEGDLKALRSMLVPLAEDFGPVIGRDITAEEAARGVARGVPWALAGAIGAAGAAVALLLWALFSLF